MLLKVHTYYGTFLGEKKKFKLYLRNLCEVGGGFSALKKAIFEQIQ